MTLQRLYEVTRPRDFLAAEESPEVTHEEQRGWPGREVLAELVRAVFEPEDARLGELGDPWIHVVPGYSRRGARLDE